MDDRTLRGTEPTQRTIDFVRGEQLRILQNCQLPSGAKDKEGKGVSPLILKMVLVVIDQHARGRPGGCTASVSTIAKLAAISRRQCFRALDVLDELSVLCAENDAGRRGRIGSPTTRRTIVWSELALFCDRGLFGVHTPGQTQPPQHEGNVEKHGATARDQSALGADQSALGADQSALGADQSALGADQSAPRGHTKRLETTRNVNEAPSDVLASDEAEDGARYFFEDEVAAVRAKANDINRWVCTRTSADRELVLKVATLAVDRQLPEAVLAEVLESYQRKREAGDPVKNPRGWFWTTLVNQCRQRGFKLEQLLARTDFPRELLSPPASHVSETH